MGDEHAAAAPTAPRRCARGVEHGTDFTVAVEEEFALLDPASLDLVNRFEEVQAAARDAARAAPRRRADCIRGRGQDRSLRVVRRDPGRDDRAPRALDALVGRSASGWRRRAPTPGPTGRSSGSSTRRTTAATTSCFVTLSGETTPSACTYTSASAAPTARSRSRTGSATSSLSSSRSRPARRSWRASTPACTRRGPRSSRASSPAAGSPTPFASWQQYEDYVRFLYVTGSVTEHTQLWWSVRPHLGFPTVEIRIADGQPDLGEAQALAAFGYALAARIARARRGGAGRRPAAPADRGEPLARDPLRPLRRADRPRTR